MGPYRTSAETSGDSAANGEGSASARAEMWFVAAVLVPVSVVRVVGAVVGHETFGAEATLALFVVLAAMYAFAAKVARVAAKIVRRLGHPQGGRRG